MGKWNDKLPAIIVNSQLQYIFANSSVEILKKVGLSINEALKIRKTLIKKKKNYYSNNKRFSSSFETTYQGSFWN